jgi:hypothetical protein
MHTAFSVSINEGFFIYDQEHTSEQTTAVKESLILHTIIQRNGTLKHWYSEINGT